MVLEALILVALRKVKVGAKKCPIEACNILGIGGYHTITGVTTTLTPQSFTTSIKSHHYYSGDNENPDSTSLKSSDESGGEELIEAGVAEDASTRDADFCKTEILEEINFDTTGIRGSISTPTAPIEAPAPPPTDAATPTVSTEGPLEVLGVTLPSAPVYVVKRSTTVLPNLEGRFVPGELVEYSDDTVKFEHTEDGSQQSIDYTGR